jgi:hypothetical protein
LQVLEVCHFIDYQIESEYLVRTPIWKGTYKGVAWEESPLAAFLKLVEKMAIDEARQEKERHWGIPEELA